MMNLFSFARTLFLEEENPSVIGWEVWLIIAVLIGLMFLIPQLGGRKRREEARKIQQMIDNVKAGDRIKTIGGLVGEVVEIIQVSPRERNFVLKTGSPDSPSYLTFDFIAIAYVITEEAKTEGEAQFVPLEMPSDEQVNQLLNGDKTAEQIFEEQSRAVRAQEEDIERSEELPVPPIAFATAVPDTGLNSMPAQALVVGAAMYQTQEGSQEEEAAKEADDSIDGERKADDSADSAAAAQAVEEVAQEAAPAEKAVKKPTAPKASTAAKKPASTAAKKAPAAAKKPAAAADASTEEKPKRQPTQKANTGARTRQPKETKQTEE